MLELSGYADRLSARPGETISFKMSNATAQPVKASLVRVISADPNPAGPGVREEPVDVSLPTLDAAEHQVRQGSYAVAELGDACSDLASFTLALSVLPTRPPEAGESTILAWGQPERDSGGVALKQDTDGRLVASIGDVRAISEPVATGQWLDIAVSRDQAAGRMDLRWRKPGGSWHYAQALQADGDATGDVLTMASDLARSRPAFNGRIEGPRLYSASLDVASLDQLFGLQPSLDDLVFAWDFARETSSSQIVDTGPHGLRGKLINHPTRAMRSSRWTGREMCWRHAPQEYGAIHFHDDDITDCEWPTALEWQVPADLASGCYALKLEAGLEAENIPFFVVPAKGRPTADVAVLVSTFTYTIYANHARPEWRLGRTWKTNWRAQAQGWQAYPHNPGDHPEYGWSTYNDHTDGSGISIASWHRPMLNTRVGYITYPDADIRGSGLRHYPADTHLHTWLEDQGIAFDIITDYELHHEGHDLLKDYRVVMTGSHPEYHTRPMLDALTAYRDNGGRLMYLGGNGFYWKIALDPERDGVIEIRRAEGGIRAWAAEPGEYYNQFDGEYGGLWRRNGRPPQDLCGVGFSAQGNFVGSHYVVAPDARTSRAGWILDGVATPTFGGHGLSGHGAAGFELDRADKALGTPGHAVVLASSEGHEPEAPWVLVPEERLTHLTNIPGEKEPELIRSDIVFFETPGDGAVFSVGSITFCGSLLTNSGDNDVSRIVRNVLDRFRDPASRFALPAGAS